MRSGSRSATARLTASMKADSNFSVIDGVRSRYLIDVYGIISDIPVIGKGRALMPVLLTLQLQNMLSADASDGTEEVSVKNTG